MQLCNNAIVAIGDPVLRASWIKSLRTLGYKLPSIVHPSACVSPSVVLGDASVVFANAVIQSSTSIGVGIGEYLY